MSSVNNNAKDDEKRKIGEGSLKAWARMGHKELSAVIPAFPDSVRVVEEPGMPSNPTSYEVSKQRGAVQEKQDTVHGKQHDRQMEPELEP